MTYKEVSPVSDALQRDGRTGGVPWAAQRLRRSLRLSRARKEVEQQETESAVTAPAVPRVRGSSYPRALRIRGRLWERHQGGVRERGDLSASLLSLSAGTYRICNKIPQGDGLALSTGDTLLPPPIPHGALQTIVTPTNPIFKKEL